MRDSFVFYRSFHEAVMELEPEAYKKIMSALIMYALDGTEPEDMDAVARMAFMLMRPQIDANNKRRDNGMKGAKYGSMGGRPKTPNKPQENPKETPNKPQENPKETPNVNVNVNVNDNDNVNVNDLKEKGVLHTPKKKTAKHRHGTYGNVLLTEDEYQKLFKAFGEPLRTQLIEKLDEAIEEKGYKYKSHYLTIAKKDSWVQERVRYRPDKPGAMNEEFLKRLQEMERLDAEDDVSGSDNDSDNEKERETHDSERYHDLKAAAELYLAGLAEDT